MTVFGSSLAAVGLAKETAYGIPAAPALLVPWTQLQLPDQVQLLSDAGWRGAPAASYQHQQSGRESSIKLGGPLFASVIGYPLAGILGQAAFTAGAPNQWAFSLLNTGNQQPPSQTVTVADPLGPLQFPGARWSQLALSFNPDSLVSWSGQIEALASVPAPNVVMPAPASRMPLFPGWVGSAVIGGATEAQLTEASVTLSRGVLGKRNVDGSLSPYTQRSDVLTVTGSATVVAASDLYRQQFVSGLSSAITLAFTVGAGTGLRSLTLQMSSVTFTNVERSYGKKWIELAIAFTADANLTDGQFGGYSPVKAIVQNVMPAGTYA